MRTWTTSSGRAVVDAKGFRLAYVRLWPWGTGNAPRPLVAAEARKIALLIVRLSDVWKKGAT
jgi:hypothetical protein